jgi:menaquinone-dependent protoporphyrinogen oxidase
MTLLVVYASSYGQTERIARRIAETAKREGATVTLAPVESLRQPLAIGDAGRIVVAGSVKWGKHQKTLVRFVRRNRVALGAAETTFVSVSGAAGSEAGLAHAREYVDTFIAKTRWMPSAVELMPGGMAFSKFGWLTRRLVIASDRKLGIVREPTSDYDYTDWEAVDRLAVRLARGTDAITAPQQGFRGR